MDLKKKYENAKTKLKENRTAIIAAVSTGVAIASTVAYVITKDKLEKAWEANREILHRDITVGAETLYISDETQQEILDGSKDVWFNVDGHRFDLILHPTED
jgi:hypothetical protein